jgi:hypothetical protein
MQISAVAARQRQMRVFVVAWLGVTLLMGALTFAGIYYSTGLDENDDNNGENVSVAVVPNAGPDDAESANNFDLSQISTTPVPTANTVALAPEPDVPAPVEPETEPEDTTKSADAGAETIPEGQGGGPEQASVPDAADNAESAPPAQAEATPVPSLTPLPVNNEAFQVGIQVAPNHEPDVYRIWMTETRDKLRLGWIKQQVRWEDVEPEPGQYNWADLDTPLQVASERGVKVMLSVVTAPAWAREPGNQRLEEVGPPADPQTYANFLITMLYRYPGQIHAIEVWNEMNIDREWASVYGLDARNYVDMLRIAYNAIKMVDPGIIVISGALSPTGLNDGVSAYDDFTYMDMLIQAGMLDTTDCVGVHHNGYNIGPNVPWNNVPNDPTATFRGPFDNPHHSWSFYSTLNGYAQRIQQAGSTKKLCITEFGWATTEGLTSQPRPGFEFANDNTLAEQAQFFDEAIQSMNSWGFVWLAFVWNLNYGAIVDWGSGDDNVPYSLLRPGWAPAPAYDVIAKYNFREQ